MESLQQLSNESFSYSWLINIKPASFDAIDDEGLRCSFDAQDGGAFIEMDPDFISMRWTSEGHDFDFGLPSSQAPVLVHADQIFSNGVILPLHLISSTPSKCEAVSDRPYSALSSSPPVDSSKTLLVQSNRYCPCYVYALPSGQISSDCSPVFRSVPSTPTSKSSCPLKRSPSRIPKLKLPFLANCVRSPKRMLRKYWSSLLTPLCKKINELRLTSMKAVRGGGDPVGAPGAGNSFSRIEWCYSNATADMGDERKIYDAVLHCKKSIDK